MYNTISNRGVSVIMSWTSEKGHSIPCEETPYSFKFIFF